MNKNSQRDGMLKKWRRTLHSPVQSFYRIDMKPETIYQELRQSGKPVALYEKLLVQAFFIIFLVLGLLSIIGVHWNVWVGGVGLIAAAIFGVVETILFRSRSCTSDVKLARTIIIFYMALVIIVFFQITIKGF